MALVLMVKSIEGLKCKGNKVNVKVSFRSKFRIVLPDDRRISLLPTEIFTNVSFTRTREELALRGIPDVLEFPETYSELIEL